MKRLILVALVALSALGATSQWARADYFGNDPRTQEGSHFDGGVFSDAEKNGI